MIDNSDSTVGS